MIHDFDVLDRVDDERRDPGWDAPVWVIVGITGLIVAVLALAVLAVFISSRGSTTRSGSAADDGESLGSSTPRSIGRA